MNQTQQKKKLDLLITGVGGQGAILASDIIGKAAVTAGLPIRAAETHGMAQRGGSVVNHIRVGNDYGSMIPKKVQIFCLPLSQWRRSGIWIF